MKPSPDANQPASTTSANPYEAPKTFEKRSALWIWVAFGIVFVLAAAASAGAVGWMMLAADHTVHFDEMRRGPVPNFDPPPVEVPPDGSVESPPEP